MVHNCLRLFACVILCFLTIAVIKSAQYTHNNFIDCKITKILNRNCYDYNGAIWLEQYVQINENKLAFTICGKVLNCETSPCIVDIRLNNTYNCYLYRENLYNLSNGDNGKLFFITLTVLVSALLTYTTIHFILYDRINIVNDCKTFIYKINTEYNIVNSESTPVSFSDVELFQINEESR